MSPPSRKARSMEENGREDGQARRPTPVRMAMDTGEPQEREDGSDNRTFTHPSSGEEWIARVSGRSMSGVVPLRVIPLMEVGFSRAEDPGVAVRRAVWQGDSLDDLDDAGLLRLFDSSGPFSRPVQDSSVPAPEQRGGKNRPRRNP